MKLLKKQIKIMKDQIDEFNGSDERFILMISKNKDGTDKVTKYAYNMSQDKLNYYLSEAMDLAEINKMN